MRTAHRIKLMLLLAAALMLQAQVLAQTQSPQRPESASEPQREQQRQARVEPRTQLRTEQLSQAPAPTPAPDYSAAGSRAPAVIDGRVFQRLDANGDGRLTPEEARIDPAVADAFERIDTNGDGIVTRPEARSFDEKRTATEDAAGAASGSGAAREGSAR